MLENALIFLICLGLVAVVPAVSSADKKDMVETHAFLHRYASWYALLFPNTESNPPILFNDMNSSITAGAVTIGYDSTTQLAVSINCDMLRNEGAFINQMVALIASMSDDEAAALTFTEQQTSAWINVCTRAVQRRRNDPYHLGAYDLYILSSDDDVQLYAILSAKAQAGLADGVTGVIPYLGGTQEKVVGEDTNTALATGDEEENVHAIKRSLFEFGFFSSDN